MKEYKHIGVYGLLIKEGKILLIKKSCGPYTGQLDLPGGGLEYGETPEETLKREFIEETGILVKKYKLYDANAVRFVWNHKNEELDCYHIGIFYKIQEYENDIKKEIEVDEVNDDSLGAEFYDIDSLKKEELSRIALLELEKLGYHFK